MRAATARQMQEIDRAAIKGMGIPGPALMERAGVATARAIMAEFSQRKALVLCGPGNNGGDGLVIARELHNAGYTVKALVLGSKSRLSPDCALQYSIAKKLGLTITFNSGINKKDTHGAVLVDAIFGTGLNKKVSGSAVTMIKNINASRSPVISVDIASGIRADTGQVLGNAVKAEMTVTFGLPKRGHFLEPGSDHTGRLIVEDIGFPRHLYEKADCHVPGHDEMAALLPERPSNAHKGDFGHVLVLAGSRGKTGAAFMSSGACLRAGAGLVTLGGPETLDTAYQKRVTEQMYLPLPDTGKGALSEKALEPVLSFIKERATVLAMGPGMGTEPETVKLVRGLIRESPVPMVLDADALNALKGNPSTLRNAKAPVVITPHPGEFSRLMDKAAMAIKDIEADRIGSALAFAKKTGVTVLLKGAPTVTATLDGQSYINPTGNPGLAKAGSGDVLTGIVAALLAQGLSAGNSAVLGAYLHGLAADIAVTEGTSARSLIASDVMKSLPSAFAALEGGV
ncbi:hypothetical protein LCGC14_1595770 [marine sediment metagenome]|uniref:Nicotinamide nucleotide repair protein n=1 Tax=marine sediment metagenome TaxID=412755 RepID=A0A0F9IYZ5_9ZZZZ